MSVRMAAGRALLRMRRRRDLRASFEALRREDRHDPPRDVARRHDTELVDFDGARATWLDPGHSGNGVVVYFHGGSYVRGPVKEQWRWLGRLCGATGMAGLLVDYRKSPPHAFPAALDDASAAAAAVPTDRGPWFLAGDSAGGGLALALAYRRRAAGAELPHAMLLVSPWLDVTMSDPEARRNERIDSMLSLHGLARSAEVYAGGHDPRDPHISPLFGDPAGLPPMLVHVGTREMFLWDARAWRDKCLAADVDVTYVEVPGGFHDSALAAGLVPEGDRALAEQAAFLQEHAQTRVSDHATR